MYQAAAFPDPEREERYYIELTPGDRYLIPTGLFFDMEEGQSVRIFSRSGMALKQGIMVANGTGVVDADYHNEVFVILENRSGQIQKIHHGDRIAQAEVIHRPTFTLDETHEEVLQKTTRSGGFGSTGK